MITVVPVGGATPSKLPEFTYTGNYTFIDDGDDNWRIKFLTSGIFTLTNADFLVDAFLVGGGAGGNSLDGGGGGYTTNSMVQLYKNIPYTITIGAGGGSAANGGTTSGFSLTAAGGYANGDGGSAGGPRWANYGGTNGSSTSVGTGQGTTTKAFAETAGDIYSGGGGGGQGGLKGDETAGNGALDNYSDAGDNGVVNRGGGGGGGYNGTSTINGVGGSGILIIRNHAA